MSGENQRKTAIILALALAAAALLVYLPSRHFGFTNLDDQLYITDNPLVKNGLTAAGIKAAFTGLRLGYYIPVTWLSFMADAQLFGEGPGGFHLTNVILHAVNTLLLFSFLYLATGSATKSFLAAALWAFHPLRVESVAWITARKDLLSAFFLLLCLLSYLKYARKGGSKWYFLSFLAFAAGLLSKPILVVTPLVLLAADFWPLERAGWENLRDTAKKLVLEKLPFLAAALIFSALTYKSQGNAVLTFEAVPPLSRLTDVATSYFHYLRLTVWPSGLVVLDRYNSPHYGIVAALGAALLMGALSWWAWRLRARCAAPLGGLLWFFSALIPVSGIVAVGMNFVADRFTYIPHMGLLAALVWTAAHFAVKRPETLRPAFAAGLAAAAVFAVLSSVQLPNWKDGLTLFTHNSSVTGGDAFSERNLGSAYIIAGDYPKAREHLEKSLSIEPMHPTTNHYMGILLYNEKKYADAIAYNLKTLEVSPDYADAHFNIALSAVEFGNLGFALTHLEEAVAKDPGFWEAYLFMGQILNDSKRHSEALEALRRADAIFPGTPEILNEIRRAEDGLSRGRSG